MQTDNTPYFIIISGPNGAGKTTFYNKILGQNPFFANALFANSDIEFKAITSIPENAAKLESMRCDIETKKCEIRKKLLTEFSAIMTSISGDIMQRIENKNESNKDYWTEQYSLSIHIPEEQKYILENLSSRKELMYRVGGTNIHERINSKQGKNNWYNKYKKLVNTIEVQFAIHLPPLIEKYQFAEQGFQREAGMRTLNKIYTAFETKQNLIFETTGSGRQSTNLAKKAKAFGYRVYSFHPYVLRPEISVSRVQHRVEMGGHDVPQDVIKYRYNNSLKGLPDILSLVDVGIVMDNSGKKPYMPVFTVADGYLTDFAQCPEYLSPARTKMAQIYPQQSIQDLLHIPENIDIRSMSEEQRENFAQIAISSLLGQIR